MFIRVIDTQSNVSILININNISTIHEESNTIVTNGVHGQGTGIYHLDNDSMKELMKNIKIINKSTECFESNGGSVTYSHPIK